jgi:putative membrane protein
MPAAHAGTTTSDRAARHRSRRAVRSGAQDVGVAEDATRRTYLANERTYLAWWRTGVTCLAVSFGTGRIVPALNNHARWPYAVVGAGFAILGVAFMWFGARRQRAIHAAVARGEFADLDDRLTNALTAAGVVLGLGVLALVLVD